MKKVIASAGVLALGAFSVQSGKAQALTSPNNEKPWTISGTLRGFYDNNYNTQPDNSPEHLGSFGFEVRPQASVGYSDGPTTLNASYIYDERYYVSRPGNKSDQSHDFEFSAVHSFNERYSVDLLESFVVSQEPEIIDSSLSLPLRANGDNMRNSVGINFHAQATKLLGFVVGYANSWYDYTGQPPAAPFAFNGPTYGALLNRFEHNATLNARWNFTDQTVGILGYQFQAVDYLGHGSLNPAGTFPAIVNLGNPPTPVQVNFPFPYVAPSSRNDYSHFVYIGFDQSLRSDLSISVRGGAQITDYYNSIAAPGSAAPSSVGPYAEVSGQYTYMEGGTLTLGFRHSKNATDVAANGATSTITYDQESSSVYGTIDQVLTPLSPKLVARLSAQWQDSRFNGGLLYNNEHDIFYLFGINFTYSFTQYLSAETGYNYDLLESDIPGRPYNRSRVYVGVTATY